MNTPMPDPIRFGREICGDLAQAERRDGGSRTGAARSIVAEQLRPYGIGDASAAQKLLDPMRDHLSDAGLGSVSEIFDGAPPHVPRGAPCQAWSVACTLEAWWRLERAKRESGGPAHERTTPAAVSMT